VINDDSNGKILINPGTFKLPRPINSNTKYWLKLCHVTQQPIEKFDITFNTLEGSKLAENHIIICGMAENIRHFVMPLRAKHLRDPSPIIILYEKPLT